MITCPACKGSTISDFPGWDGGPQRCGTCLGEGVITTEWAETIAELKRERLADWFRDDERDDALERCP